MGRERELGRLKKSPKEKGERAREEEKRGREERELRGTVERS